jgi:6-phosphogluconolactonase
MEQSGQAATSPPARGPGSDSLMLVLPDPEALALAVAAAVVAEARIAVKRTGRFSVALSGGSTPRRAYELLGRPPFADSVPWALTHVFWGDERCVDPSDAQSNERMVREALLDQVPVPSDQVHALRCSGPALLAGEAAEEYEGVLRAHGPAMDLVLLGLGEDGHTASLFPGADTLDDQGRWVLPTLHDAVGGTAAGLSRRVTLTASYINQAASVFFVVSGKAKAGVLRQVMAEEAILGHRPANMLPAQMIHPSKGRLRWLVDVEAASELDPEGWWWL